MPKTDKIVINTGPILALIAGLGDLTILESLYKQVVVPYEVCEEVKAGGLADFGVHEFNDADFLTKLDKQIIIQPHLQNSLDLGESAVIQTALDKNIQTVCIDEAVGRRIARLNGLKITCSLGIMIRAKKEGHSIMLRKAIDKMQKKGIRLSERIIGFALKEAGE